MANEETIRFWVLSTANLGTRMWFAGFDEGEDGEECEDYVLTFRLSEALPFETEDEAKECLESIAEDGVTGFETNLVEFTPDQASLASMRVGGRA